MKTESTGVEQLPSGHFRFRIRIKGRPPIMGTFATEKEAADVRAQTLRLIADGSMEFVEGETIAAIGPRFLATRKGLRSNAEGIWRLHIAGSSLGRRVPAALERADILDWLDALLAKTTSYDPKKHGARALKPLSWQTRVHCLNLFRKFFDFCLDRKLATANPCAGVRVEKQDGDEDEGWQESWFLTAENVTSIFGYVFDDADLQAEWMREKDLATIALGTGLRLNELLCLHVEDVHADGANPHIEVRFGSWDPKKSRFRPPKGRAGERKSRSVPLFGSALNAMKRWLGLMPTVFPENKYGLAFPTKQGGRRTKAPRTWDMVVKAIGIVPRLGRRIWWHLLRHTCATSLLSGAWGVRWTLEEVRAVLGHSSVKVTERYAKVVREALNETAARAQAAWDIRGHAMATPKLYKRESQAKRRARPARLERATNSLEGSWFPHKHSRDEGSRGHVVAIADTVEVSSRRALEAIASGAPNDRALAVDALGKSLDLVEAVLAEEAGDSEAVS